MGNNVQGHQSIAAQIISSGQQTVHIDTHGTGGQGSHITVSTPNLMITIHDRAAATTYAAAWAESAQSAMLLPLYRGVQVEILSHRQPGVLVHAYGQDRVRVLYDPTRREQRVRIGYLTWVVLDKEAAQSFFDAWQQVRKMAALVLPRERAPR